MTEIDLVNHKPFVHCSAMLGSQHQYTGVMMPLFEHPTNKNSVVCIDLTRAVQELAELTSEQMSQRIFTRQDDLPEGVQRLAIKEVHYNKCPAVAPLGVLNNDSQERLNIDLKKCLENAQTIQIFIKEFVEKLRKVYSDKTFDKVTNPDHALYSGGFFNTADKNKMEQIRAANWQSLAGSNFQFNDQRLEELLFRYRARNAIDTLNSSERARWEKFRQSALLDPQGGSTLIYSEFVEIMSELKKDPDHDQRLLDQLAQYVKAIIPA